MEALKRLTLALAVTLAAVACGDDDGDETPGTGGNMDGGIKTPDSGVDGAAAKPTGYMLPDGGPLPCNAATLPANGKCGGSSCELTEAQLTATVKAGSKCGAANEVAAFCSLSAVNTVTQCSFNSIGSVTMLDKFEMETRTCSSNTLKMTDPNFSDDCLDCFVASSRCTAEKCRDKCITGTGTPACEACRISEGCIDSFYQCAGYESPLTGIVPKF
jgi:hypothetical protein